MADINWDEVFGKIFEFHQNKRSKRTEFPMPEFSFNFSQDSQDSTLYPTLDESNKRNADETFAPFDSTRMKKPKTSPMDKTQSMSLISANPNNIFQTRMMNHYETLNENSPFNSPCTPNVIKNLDAQTSYYCLTKTMMKSFHRSTFEIETVRKSNVSNFRSSMVNICEPSLENDTNKITTMIMPVEEDEDSEQSLEPMDEAESLDFLPSSNINHGNEQIQENEKEEPESHKLLKSMADISVDNNAEKSISSSTNCSKSRKSLSLRSIDDSIQQSEKSIMVPKKMIEPQKFSNDLFDSKVFITDTNQSCSNRCEKSITRSFDKFSPQSRNSNSKIDIDVENKKPESKKIFKSMVDYSFGEDTATNLSIADRSIGRKNSTLRSIDNTIHLNREENITQFNSMANKRPGPKKWLTSVVDYSTDDTGPNHSITNSIKHYSTKRSSKVPSFDSGRQSRKMHPKIVEDENVLPQPKKWPKSVVNYSSDESDLDSFIDEELNDLTGHCSNQRKSPLRFSTDQILESPGKIDNHFDEEELELNNKKSKLKIFVEDDDESDVNYEKEKDYFFQGHDGGNDSFDEPLSISDHHSAAIDIESSIDNVSGPYPEDDHDSEIVSHRNSSRLDNNFSSKSLSVEPNSIDFNHEDDANEPIVVNDELSDSSNTHVEDIEEINNNVVETNSMQTLRRSNRNRMKPCDYWRGQRPIYKFENNQCNGQILPIPTIVGVSHGTDLARLRRRRVVVNNRQKNRPILMESNPKPSLKDILDLSIHDKKSKISTKPDCEAVKRFEKLNFEPSKKSKGVYCAVSNKSMNERALGMLKFEAFARKKHCRVKFSTNFTVLYGVLSFKINSKSAIILPTGSQIEIKPSQSYSIKNLRNDEALVHFAIFSDK